MSWSAKAEGTRDEANAKIAAETSVPQSIKDAAVTMLTEFSPEKSVTVSTHGHHDGAGGGNAMLAVATVG